MKKTCWNLGIAAVALLIAMTAGRGKTFASAAPESKAPPEIAVQIENYAFSPATLTVAAGSTVRWTNKDEEPHTLVSEGQDFKSKALDTDGSFSYTFAKPGTYSYFCSLHPKMRGKIVVQ